MKNGKFETQGEIFKYLLDGGAITNLDDSCDCYVELRDGKLMFNTENENTTDPDERAGSLNFGRPEQWNPYSQIKLLKDLRKAKDWIVKLEAKILNGR